MLKYKTETNHRSFLKHKVKTLITGLLRKPRKIPPRKLGRMLTSTTACKAEIDNERDMGVKNIQNIFYIERHPI